MLTARTHYHHIWLWCRICQINAAPQIFCLENGVIDAVIASIAAGISDGTFMRLSSKMYKASLVAHDKQGWGPMQRCTHWRRHYIWSLWACAVFN